MQETDPTVASFKDDPDVAVATLGLGNRVMLKCIGWGMVPTGIKYNKAHKGDYYQYTDGDATAAWFTNIFKQLLPFVRSSPPPPYEDREAMTAYNATVMHAICTLKANGGISAQGFIQGDEQVLRLQITNG
jgi:hypothetical protein